MESRLRFITRISVQEIWIQTSSLFSQGTRTSPVTSQSKLNQIGNIQNLLQKLCDNHLKLWVDTKNVLPPHKCLKKEGKSLFSISPVVYTSLSDLGRITSLSQLPFLIRQLGRGKCRLCLYLCVCVWIRNAPLSPNHPHSLHCSACYTWSDKNNKPCTQTVKGNSFYGPIVEKVKSKSTPRYP